ncbi:alpha/beta-hydrolase [Acaromyces ingoldii]|uniref:Alpha/beta-hydrolase n=1 Tax=Acaromyces ingoldii TaxID=215250 RepID=A0A316YEM1_9BASI|nr:alpha/beta-hydrolase [Acaromyces ingoldii]PWN87669.1 alpha/beta-hydrolase [Acaromyces ingoldii]
MCSIHHRNAWIDVGDDEGPLRLHYVEAVASDNARKDKPVVLLIHGFPQTSHQYRHVMAPLASHGFHVLAPDYRGAGKSSRPRGGYDKATMAEDLFKLVQHLHVPLPIHVVGHDLGGMVAHAFATSFPQATASIAWGECPLPGSSHYEACRFSVAKFHFLFHCVPDGLPEALVAGREGLYMQQFFDRLTVRTENLSPDTIRHYVEAYSRPGAMRAGMDTYRAFEADARRNIEVRQAQGSCTVPSLLISGALSSHASEAAAMGAEFYTSPKTALVEGSGHYLAEENPADFVAKLVAFFKSVPSASDLSD